MRLPLTPENRRDARDLIDLSRRCLETDSCVSASRQSRHARWLVDRLEPGPEQSKLDRELAALERKILTALERAWRRGEIEGA